MVRAIGNLAIDSPRAASTFAAEGLVPLLAALAVSTL